MATVQLDKVRKVYDNGKVAVAGADFTVADGELLVLVGPSGCGKSTLLRAIAGLETITSGTIRIDGRVVNDLAPRERDIAMVFQNYALYPHMTVGGNLAFGLKLRGLPRAEISERVAAAARMLGLVELLDAYPRRLSGGQRQRVALGRALVREPKVFLLDEPLSNLDAKLRAAMRVEIARLHQRLAATMIHVTHDQVEAMTLGERIVVMHEGEIQQVDTPMRLYRQPANLFVAGFLGSPAMNFFRGRLGAEAAPRFDMGSVGLPLGDAAIASARLEACRGREIVLGLRPEHLELADDDAPTPFVQFEATLEVVEPVGNEVFLNLRHGDGALVARIPPRALPAPGARVRLQFDPSRLHAFDAASGARIHGAGS
ncbi:MAG TPA: sn-glycerol-3-phosphate ABC transporter ATP-binding protein UgpC [Rhodanobacteraceae bacterium]|jgi:multiple sugar transport system ATP-binding protein|nr:sn-glycerol-3-phosphate ABC transporter ATP-binding protein UgpC [Rhodanobacteraceae bacterium]